MYNNIDLSKLFDNKSKYGKKYYQGELKENRIKEVEDNLGYKLPKSYIQLLKFQNGGYISDNFNDCWLTAIYGIGQNIDSSYGLEEQFKLWKNEWEYPNIGIPFGETQTGGHDMYFMDYSVVDQNGEPRIVRVSNEDNNARYFVANNFEEFIDMVYNNKDIDGKLIVDEKKVEQQNIEKELSDIDGNLSVCKGVLFIDIIIIAFFLFKQNWIIVAICVLVAIIIIPLWVKYEKKYKSVENKKSN